MEAFQSVGGMVAERGEEQQGGCGLGDPPPVREHP
jgi:hypothetical protein